MTDTLHSLKLGGAQAVLHRGCPKRVLATLFQAAGWHTRTRLGQNGAQFSVVVPRRATFVENWAQTSFYGHGAGTPRPPHCSMRLQPAWKSQAPPCRLRRLCRRDPPAARDSPPLPPPAPVRFLFCGSCTPAPSRSSRRGQPGARFVSCGRRRDCASW